MNNWQQTDIRWVAVLASLLLSAATLLFQETPNADAYTYVRTAEIFLGEGIVAAYQYYSWATYSILIGAVSWLGIDFFSAGLLINAFFYAILVFSFISIVREINNSEPLLLISTLCILVYPQLNEYRDFIIRDVGFWGLSLFALWQYLMYARTQLSKHALLYCGALLLASTFRVEALAYLIFTPFSLFIDSRLEPAIRKKLFFKLAAMLLSTAVLLLIILALIGLNMLSLLFDFTSSYEFFMGGRLTLPDEERALLGSLLFNEHAAEFSREYIEIFFLAGLVAILLANLFNAIGGPYLIVLLVGFYERKIRLERCIAVPVIIYLTVNALILIIFLVITRYLSSRYAMLLCLLLALFVPLIIFHILSTVKDSKRKRTQLLIALFLSYCAIDSYYSFGESKSYVADSIAWIAENTAASSALVTNNHAIAYRSGRIENYDQIRRTITAGDILAAGAGTTIAAELTFETRQLLSKEAIAAEIEFLAAFPDAANPRIGVYRRIHR